MRLLLVQLAVYRVELCYAFGLLCLLTWFVFNIWVLRDWFFPWWFPPIYTATGLPKQKLESKKREILMRARMSNAFQLTAGIGVGELALAISRRERRLQRQQQQLLRLKQQRHSIAVFTVDAWNRC